ncbi:hypothetical protein ABBQ32_009505 [Trebouxia sp. C0010 RCD-2024]
MGLANAAGLVGSAQVACLQDWVQAANADFLLVEALLGTPLDPHHSLATALPGIFVFGTSGKPFLSRPVQRDTAQQLESALAVADGASEYLSQLTRVAADNAAAEIQAGDSLQEIMAGRHEMGNGAAVEVLSQAIEAAERFPNLKAEAQAGHQLLERWGMRNEAIAQLEAVIEGVSGPVPSYISPARGLEGPTVADHEAFWAEWALRIQTLEQSIEQARQQGISLSRAKRVLKELQAQANAAEAASKLETVLQRRPCRASVLRVSSSNPLCMDGFCGQSKLPYKANIRDASSNIHAAAASWDDSFARRRRFDVSAVVLCFLSWDDSFARHRRFDVSAVVLCFLSWDDSFARRRRFDVSAVVLCFLSWDDSFARRRRFDVSAVVLCFLSWDDSFARRRRFDVSAGVVHTGRAEAASAAASGGQIGLSVGPDMLTPLINRAKQQLEVERAKGGLHKAIAVARTNADLPQLDAAIQAAHKAGLQERATQASRHASELRARLNQTAQATAQLASAVEALQRGNRQEDAAAVKHAIEAAQACGAGLQENFGSAQQALDRWQLATNNEAKLAKALSDGTSVLALSRAVQEATACGVKVTEAKRVLKLMQALESAQQPSSGSDTSSAYRTLKTRLEAAKQGGVCPSFMQPAKGQLLNLLMAEVKKAVETALKTRPGRQARLKTGAVRAALDQAETLLEEGLGDEAEPFLSSAQNWRALHVKTGVNGQQLPGRLAGEAGGGKPVLEDLMAIPDAAAVKRMLGEAYRFLEEEAEELSRLHQEHAAEAKLKREQQLEREKLVKEKAERDRAERERADREKVERRWKERKEQAAALKAKQLQADHNKHMRDADDHFAQVHQGSAWRQRQPPLVMQPSSPPSDQHSIHHEQPYLPEQQFRPQAGLVSTNSAASTQQARPPPPGFEDSTAGSQWLEAVQLAGLAEPPIHIQPTMDQQPHHQIWVDTQAVATMSHPGLQHSDAYDGYEASLSERHSDATSDTTQPEAATHAHKTEGRTLTLSPSIRSSAASTDDLLSPTLTQHLANGFTNGSHNAVSHQPDAPTDLRSSIRFNGSTQNHPPAGQQPNIQLFYGGSATSGLVEGGAGLGAGWGLLRGQAQAGVGHFGQSLTGGVFACEPHPRTLSPELGTERSSSSSFSSSVTAGTKLTYADLGGAGWGMEASHRSTFAPPIAAFRATADPDPTAAFQTALGGPPHGGPSSGADSVWAAQHSWCTPPPQGDPGPRPHSAGPSRPRSADPLRRGLDVPFDAGMAALGFLSDDAQPTGLDGNAREFVPARRPAGDTEEPAFLDAPLPRTLRVRRPCRYFLQGYCREGSRCRFGHNQQDIGLTFLTPQASAAVHSPFSLAPPAQMLSATSLVDPTIAFQPAPAASATPAPQALADPSLGSDYRSAAAFYFNASRATDLAFPAPRLLQPLLPSNLDAGAAGAVYSTEMPAVTSYAPSSPTGASKHPVGPQPAQSPFPGMGAGVHGSSFFKNAENLNESFGTWSPM